MIFNNCNGIFCINLILYNIVLLLIKSEICIQLALLLIEFSVVKFLARVCYLFSQFVKFRRFNDANNNSTNVTISSEMKHF